MKITDSHENLLKLFQEKEAKGHLVSLEEVLEASNWKETTFATYYGKGQLAEFLNEASKGLYEVSNTLGISVQDFAKLLSQSKNRRDLGHNCKSKLSKALLRKSRENMLLALELYNNSPDRFEVGQALREPYSRSFW